MWIEALIAVTLLAAVVVFLAPDTYAPRLAFVSSLLPLAGSLLMWSQFTASGNALLQGGSVAFRTQIQWITLDPYTINWFVGLDGVSLPLLLLTTVLVPLAIVSAWTPIEERLSQFYGLVLFTEAGLIGVFSVLDFFVWFVFWEATLVPMYLLIGIWGGPRRKYAAIKFFVYTNIASLAMFIGFMALVFGLGDAVSSFSMPAIAQALHAGELTGLGGVSAGTLKTAAFIAMFAGFAVKVPVFPLHTWLPDAYTESPTPVSILLAGVLVKMGTYALLRFNFTMLYDVATDLAVPIAILGIVNVIYGALVALAQQDLKRIVAYSSISSIGYVILGLVAFTVYGIGGATFQMIAHGLLTGLLFMVVGVIYNATHTRMVDDISGIADRMPVTAGVFVTAAFGYMGLPLMAGFAGEFMIFLGTFQSAVLPFAPVFTAVAMFGIVIVAGYYLFAMQRTLFGPYHLDTDYEVGRAPMHDIAALFVLVGLVVLLGVVPDTIFVMIQDAVAPIVGLGGGA